MTTILLLTVVLSADVPKGLKDPQKWLAAKERREAVESERLELAKSIRANRHYQEMLDRNDRIRYYNNGGYVHPTIVNQMMMSQIQSAVYAETFYRTVYPWAYINRHYGYDSWYGNVNVFVRRY